MQSTLKTKLCCVVLIMLVITCDACQKGHVWQYKGAALICDKCSPGTFMPEVDHNKTECYPCTKLLDADTEVEIRECSIEEDSLIICKPGLFRINNTCKTCAVCEAGYELQACSRYGNTVCCRSDKFYVHDNSDGVKVCSARTLPCKQGQYFVSKDTCLPCPSNTYMAENNHNNTACFPCRHIPEHLKLDCYVAMVCNITRNSTFVGNDHNGPYLDTESFNCSLLSRLYQKCLGKEIHDDDLNKCSDTDQTGSTQAARDVGKVFHVLLILGTVMLLLLIVYVWCVSGINKCVIGRNKLLLPLIRKLTDMKDILAKCLFAILCLLVVCYLVTLTVVAENPPLIIFIHVVGFVTAFCVGAVIIIAILCMLLFQHMPERTSPDCTRSLCDEADKQHMSEIDDMA